MMRPRTEGAPAGRKSQAERAARRQKLIDQINALSSAWDLRRADAAAEGGNLRTLFGPHVLPLARLIATTLEAEGEGGLYSWYPFTAEFLSHKGERVEDLCVYRTLLQQHLSEVSATLQHEKQELALATHDFTSGVAAILDNRMTPRETRVALQASAGPALAIAEERRAQLVQSRLESLNTRKRHEAETADRVEQVKKELERSKAELSVLRGQPVVDAPAPAPAPKKTSRRKSSR